MEPGKNFLHYRILKTIGKGGFGVTYSAQNLKSGGYVAIKILHSNLCKDTKIVHRFHREARLAAKLSHPNVIKILDEGIEGDIHFIIMELSQGKNLLQILSKAPYNDPLKTQSFEELENTPLKTQSFEELENTLTLIPNKKEERTNDETKTITLSSINKEEDDETQTISLPAKPKKPGSRYPLLETAFVTLKQCACVLEEASKIGLVHRDIKPENILVEEDETGQPRVKLLDFGLAKSLKNESLQLSEPGTTVGTPAYMSPEQLKALPLDVRSDLYSLGATIYTFLSGTPPFPGPTIKDYMKQILTISPKPLPLLNRDIPRNLSLIIHHLLEKNPENRYQKPSHLIEDLDRYSRKLPPFFIKKKKTKMLTFFISLVIFTGVSFLLLSIGKQQNNSRKKQHNSHKSESLQNPPESLESSGKNKVATPENNNIQRSSADASDRSAKTTVYDLGDGFLINDKKEEPSPQVDAYSKKQDVQEFSYSTIASENVLKEQDKKLETINPSVTSGTIVEHRKEEPKQISGFTGAFNEGKINTTSKDRIEILKSKFKTED